MQKKMIELIAVADFNRQILERDGLKIVRFCAEWSGPCQIMGPIYHDMHSIYNNSASFYKIDIDKVPLLKKEFGVTVLPTILFFEGGAVVDFVTGLISRESFVKKLDKAID